jgi:3'-phosphoadenosine 5'-phosphosulfate sulfotransferase (PAPS reductase)/FAD synthetase
MQRIYHIGISGGKDSTALLLWMVYESGIPREQMVATFCDTQNEADETYQHVVMLSEKVFPIQWLRTEGFIQLAKRKGRFPSAKARFCTQELKLLPTKAFLEDLSEQFEEVIPVSGVRRGESEERSKLPEWGNPLESYFGLKEWRPLIDWQIEDVLAIHAKYDVPLNPLYGMGATRVGCFPCINSNKREMRMLASSFPERINQIREWEGDFDNLNGMSTFFPRKKVPARFRSKTITTAKGKPMRVCTIDDVVTWAKTGWRATGNAPDLNGLFELQLQEMEPVLCLSQYQACE